MENLNLSYPRGDTSPLTFFIKGNWTAEKLRFSLFANNEIITSAVLLTINSEVSNVATNELNAFYDSAKKKTKFIITPKREYTESFSGKLYYYSLTTLNDDESEKETICVGEFTLLWSGENVWNGIPDEPEKISIIKPSEIGEGNFVKIEDGKPAGVNLDQVIADAHIHKSYLHELSQIDIDNKYIDANYLSGTSDLTTILIFIDDLIKLVYLDDYVIINNQIAWEGLAGEQIFAVGDKLGIYYSS